MIDLIAFPAVFFSNMASPQQLFKNVSAGKFKTAYYFYGSEDYRLVEAEKFLAHQFLPDRQMAVNYRRMDARKTNCGELIAQLSNLPMLGDRQVFIITDIQSYKPTEVDQILRLLSPPDPNRLIVFSTPSARTVKKNSAFFSKISSVAETVEFRKQTVTEATATVRAKLQREDLSIEPDAMELLVGLLGGSRGGLEAEIAKLINYAAPGESITVEAIREVSSGYEVFNIFELADLVVACKTRQVLKMIRSLLAGGNSPATLTSLLQQHFISVYLVKNGHKPLGNRSFLTAKFRQQGHRFSNERLEQIIIDIAATDAGLRKSGPKPEVAFEMLVLEMARENR